MAYDPNVETEKSLKALEKQIYKEYSRAYEEMSKTADQYFRTLEDRYKIEYEAYQRGAYTKQEFDLWYKTQIERGQGYNHMRDQLAGRMVEANKVASAYINDKTPSIYSLNYNHEAYRIEGAHPSARFDIYDEQTVKRLIEGGNAVEFKTVNPNPVRDYNWNKDQITSALTSGILQGKPIDKIADSFLTVMERNRTSAMRNARTAYTSAQNAGRQESYRSAKRMGITMMKEWLATTDERTRASHGAMDGERVETDQTFSNELMYPADPDGAPEEVYNCRCTMFAVLPDINDEKRETYSDWIKRKEAEMSDKEAKSEKDKELKKAIERWNASHYNQTLAQQKAEDIIYRQITEEEFSAMSHSITREERSIIYGKGHFEGYVNSSNARKINSMLREGKELDSEQERIKKTLDHVIGKNSMPENVQVVRYVYPDALKNIIGVEIPPCKMSQSREDRIRQVNELLSNVQNGYIDREHSILSASMVRDLNVMKDKGVEMIINVKEGTPCYITTNKKESEVIFGMDSQLELKSVRYDTDSIPYKYVIEYDMR